MKLITKRSQRPTTCSEPRFSLHCHLELTAEELAVIHQYGLGHWRFPTHGVDEVIRGQSPNLQTLMEGYDCGEALIDDIMRVERAIVERCRELECYVHNAVSWVGDREYDFHF